MNKLVICSILVNYIKLNKDILLKTIYWALFQLINTREKNLRWLNVFNAFSPDYFSILWRFIYKKKIIK